MITAKKLIENIQKIRKALSEIEESGQNLIKVLNNFKKSEEEIKLLKELNPNIYEDWQRLQEIYYGVNLSSKLKPCPFCGSEKIERRDINVCSDVILHCIGCHLETPYFKTMEGLKKYWNERE